ncbi:hypothetical protein TNCV_5051081 [Trichonephila clavipes]|nr:hypothetical protein TNCV_5051081 [Trichonephila clavipes]
MGSCNHVMKPARKRSRLLDNKLCKDSAMMLAVPHALLTNIVTLTLAILNSALQAQHAFDYKGRQPL